MSSRAVLVTGAAGFIGSALVDGFAAAGWRAIGAGRVRPQSFTAEWRPYDLRWPALPDALFEGVDAIVHGAYAKGEYAVNVEAGSLLLAAARAHGIERVVFLSSLAAHEGALSVYGRQKLELQRRFAAAGALVVRPGLVLGDGSIFRTTCEYLRAHRFVPLIGGGEQPLQTVFVGDLVAAIVAAVGAGVKGIFTVAERDPVTYREFYREVGARLHVRPAFVPVPFAVADLAIRGAQALHVALPVDRENLLGLRAMAVDRVARLDPPSGPVPDYRGNIRLAIP